MTQYSKLLKEWRHKRRLSQMDLALEADVSARHISFLETGRSRPSADMIIHLSEVLSAPVDARNQMMRAAGFAPRYGTTALDEETMRPIREAIEWTLERHAPFPGMALNRVWDVVKLNSAARRLFSPLGITEGSRLLDLFTHPMMPQLVENWPEVAHYTALRLRAESAAAGGVPELDEAIEALLPFASAQAEDTGRPSIPTIYRFGDTRLSLYGTIAQFSTVSDETLDDLKVELFFPADDHSRALLRGMAEAQHSRQ